MDNESFLASLENVNFSVTPPSTRRNNYSSSSLVRSPLQPHFEAPHPAPFALPPVHYPLSDPGGGLDNTNRLAEVGVPSQNRRYMHSPGNQNNNSVHPFNVNSVANVEPNHDHDNGSLFLWINEYLNTAGRCQVRPESRHSLLLFVLFHFLLHPSLTLLLFCYNSVAITILSVTTLFWIEKTAVKMFDSQHLQVFCEECDFKLFSVW